MRISFDTVFVAVAVCQVSAGAPAEPSGIATKSLYLLSAGGSEVVIERYLRGQETVQDDEERVGTDTAAVESAVNALKPAFGPEHIEEWLTAKKSPVDVVKLLEFDKAENIHPENFAVLGNYVKQLKMADPKSKDSIIKAFTTHYGDNGVFKIIEAAKRIPETAKLAKRLQGEQFQYWLSVKRTPKDVLAIMELYNVDDKLLEKPEILTWVKYLDEFKEEYPHDPESKIPIFEYFLQEISEKRLIHMLIAAKEVPSTEKLAVRIQAEQTLSWLKKGTSPFDVFADLELEKAGVTLFDSPTFDAWMKYVDDYNSIHETKKVNVFTMLKQWYPKETLVTLPIDMFKSQSFKTLAMAMKKDLQNEWFNRSYTVLDVENEMKAVKPRERSTLHRASEDYPRYFQIRQKRITEYGNTVNKHTEVLVKMVFNKLMNLKKKDHALEVMNALLKRCLHESVDPQTVSQWLRVEKTAADSDSKQLNVITKQLNENYREMYDEHRNTHPAKRLKTTHGER